MPEVNGGNQLVFKIERAFNVKDVYKFFGPDIPDRDFTLHSSARWRVGFFDQTGKVRVQSDVMTLVLESGHK